MKKRSYLYQREKMIEKQLSGRGIKDDRVLQAFSEVERHQFVEESLWDRAYNDCPLPIGKNQTISQPYIVGLMTESLELTGNERVLEIGTGSGYQAAILSRLVQQVFSIERHPDLARNARKVFENLGIHNIAIRIGDGSIGWSEFAPYDAIIITAAAPKEPGILLNQLAEGGKLIVPVGSENTQRLLLYIKEGGKVEKTELCYCAFVPLIGTDGWNEKQLKG